MNIFNRKSKTGNAEKLDQFHATLTDITETKHITYRDAFVQYMDNASLENCGRETIEQYLVSKGFTSNDVQLLADEYCLVVEWRKLD